MRNDLPAAPAPIPQTVLVCINRRFRSDQPSCAGRGSELIAMELEAGILARRLNVRLERSVCMGQCSRGPTVRFSPAGRFNLETASADIPALLDEIEALCGRLDDDDAPPLHLLGS